VRGHLALVGALAALAVAGLTATSYAWAADRAKDEARAQLGEQARRAAGAITADLASGRKTVSDLAATPGIEGPLQQEQPCNLSSDGSVDFPVIRLDLVRADGAVGCSSDPELVGLSRAPHAQSAWLRPALAAAVLVQPAVHDGPLGQDALVVTARIGSAARPLGVVAAVAPLRGIGRALATAYAGVDHESFTLVESGSGALLSTSERSAGGTSTRPRDPAEAQGSDQAERLYVSADVTGTPWRVVAGRRTSLIVSDAQDVALRQAVLGGAVLLALLVAVAVLDRRIVAPLRALREAVVDARRSPERQRVEARGASELVELGEEFNAMQDVRFASQAQLEHMVMHDSLTGLPNRLGLRGVLDQHVGQGSPAAVVSLGLDRFRILNESLGHEVADRVLVQVAARLLTVLGEDDVLARFRGDEFVAFCPGIGTGEAGAELARLMADVLREPLTGEGFDVAVTGTAGVAVTAGGRASAGQLLRQADLAMHHAKRSALDVAVYDPDQGSRAREHVDTERQLRLAMERGELLLHYQPLIDVATNDVVGAEALIRWSHPERGLLPPGAFLPVAERTGQVVELGAIALRLGCRQVSRWEARGLRIPVSVNVAVEQLRRGDLPAMVAHELAEAGIEPTLLCLEITESSLLQGVASDLDQLTELRALGVHLSIDDFGTGYSSLAYLQNLPVDRLKIDISFVRRVARDVRARHLVNAIIGMAHALSLDVVAEGVEEQEQLLALEQLGCQQVQGFLLGKPMPPGELVELLQARRPAVVPATRQPA
jgi:diguanylate cyclase (GGDEF)-like protein